jgi:hypothetical protein
VEDEDKLVTDQDDMLEMEEKLEQDKKRKEEEEKLNRNSNGREAILEQREEKHEK